MGTIPRMIPRCMEIFRRKQMKLDELTQLGWVDAADYLHEIDKKYGTTELNVPAVVKQHMDNDEATSAVTIFGEHMVSLYIIPGISLMPQGTSRPGSSHRMVGSGRAQSYQCIASLPPNAEPDLSLIKKSQPIESISLYPCSVPSN